MYIDRPCSPSWNTDALAGNRRSTSMPITRSSAPPSSPPKNGVRDRKSFRSFASDMAPPRAQCIQNRIRPRISSRNLERDQAEIDGAVDRDVLVGDRYRRENCVGRVHQIELDVVVAARGQLRAQAL